MWPEDAFSLPARDGYDVGGAQERAMSARVDGYGGIRETYEVNPDGSVTTLRTRLGWPAFETTGARSAESPTVPARGFVAKVPGGRAVLFNPYTMAVLKSPYLPASNSYSVQDFGTSWNVAPADTTHWYDVVLFDGTTIKVNSKAMPSLRITANHGFPAIPYVINRETSDDQYGNSERNTTEKRVFAVGRFSVKSWGGGGVVETLSPSAPRTDHKAMTLGQLSSSDDKAHMWQMYYSGYAWDSWIGEWYFSGASVQMLLTSEYLVKTDIDPVISTHPIASFGSPSTTSGVTDVPRAIPEAIMTLVGHAELENVSGGFATPGGYVWVRYPWDGFWTAPVSAFENTSYSRTVYFADESSIATVCDKVLEVSCTNTATFDSNTSYVHYPYQFTSASGNIESQILIYFNGTTSPAVINYGLREGNDYGVYAKSSNSFSWASETYEMLFSVSSGFNLISGRAYRKIETGAAISVTQYDWTTDFIANPRDHWDADNGYNVTGKGIKLVPYGFDPSDPTLFAEAAARAQAIADAFVGQECRSTTDVGGPGGYGDIQRYTFTVVDRPVPDRQELSWSTKDYLLYDERNGVEITIEGEFAGADSSASLTVNLRTKTRHHDTVQTLYNFPFTYSELVPLRQIVSTSRNSIPSPQIRAIFAPLYQEQGSFKGAHYVTLDEENNGATPFHGFNFLLYLRAYSEFSACNEDNETGQAAYFIPCNLLEMLYAFVFSSEMGVALSGERYPVTRSANFTTLMTTLFSNPVRVSVRNGTIGGWTDALGSDFADVPNVSLHRA